MLAAVIPFNTSPSIRPLDTADLSPYGRAVRKLNLGRIPTSQVPSHSRFACATSVIVKNWLSSCRLLPGFTLVPLRP